MKYDYFIASRWRNKERVVQLVEELRQKGKKVYSFFESEGKYELKDCEQKYTPEEFMQHFESRNWQSDKAIREVFEVDIDALKNSDSLILFLPAGKSAHIEAGVAYGMGKKCILIGEQKEAESLYLIFDDVYATEEEFLTSLIPMI